MLQGLTIYGNKGMKIYQLKKKLKNYSWFRRSIKLFTVMIDKRDDKLIKRWIEGQERKWLSESDFCQDIKFSVVVPIYNTPKKYFDEMVSSVLNQTYRNWELILVDDFSSQEDIKKNLDKIIRLDKRIKTFYLNENQGISAATNRAIKESSGDFIVLFDHDDILHSRALESMALEIEKNPTVKFLYTDEAKIDDQNMVHQVFLKPKWNYDLLRSVNYITHLTAIKRELVLNIGGENSKYDGSQDWDLFIRATQAIQKNEIIHIPKVLYYWRVHRQSTAGSFDAKPYVLEAQKNTLTDDAKRNHKLVDIIYDHKNIGQWYEKYHPVKNPKIDWCVWGEYIDTSKEVDYVVFVKNIKDRNNVKNLDLLAAEASRENIGMVVPYIKNKKNVINNLKGILSGDAVALIKNLSWRSVSKHIYTTTKYNLKEVDVPVAVVEMKKIRKVMRKNIDNITSYKLSKMLVMAGYSSLYNPHIMVKEDI